MSGSKGQVLWHRGYLMSETSTPIGCMMQPEASTIRGRSMTGLNRTNTRTHAEPARKRGGPKRQSARQLWHEASDKTHKDAPNTVKRGELGRALGPWIVVRAILDIIDASLGDAHNNSDI